MEMKLHKLTKSELVAKCELAGINPSKLNKTELIALLTNNSNTYLETFTKSDIFTPDSISQQMANMLRKGHNLSLLEPAVGTGNLLKYIDMDQYSNIDVFDIKESYLDAVPKHPRIQTHLCDFLKYDNGSKRYDNIILNPPYIRIQELPAEYVVYIKQTWSLLDIGNIDIYYAFLLKCLDLLADNGTMVAITPNSYIHNKSASMFRKYLFENTLIAEIIDFKEKHVFDNAAVYCCITVFSKTPPKDSLLYNGSSISYSLINSNSNKLQLLHLNTNTSSQLLRSICKVTNGIATLRDSIYIHDTRLYDEPCWRRIKTSNAYKWCIYPYSDAGVIIAETEFKAQNSKTYEYLLSMKSVLSERDHGKKKYATWYAYGRTQSIIISKKEKVIYIPSFVNPNQLPFYVEPPTLHVSCLCIEPNDVSDIPFIIETIKKNIDYINNNSSKKNNGWINLSTTILHNVPL